MTYKGVVKGKVVELEGEAALPEGTRVTSPRSWPRLGARSHPRSLKSGCRQLVGFGRTCLRLVMRWKSFDSFDRGVPANESKQGSLLGCKHRGKGGGHRPGERQQGNRMDIPEATEYLRGEGAAVKALGAEASSRQCRRGRGQMDSVPATVLFERLCA
jgi:hypothetical protein